MPLPSTSFPRNHERDLGLVLVHVAGATALIRRRSSGAEIYRNVCIACHGPDGKLGSFGATDLTKFRISPAKVVDAVCNGRELTVMRGFRHEFSAAEIDSVTAYVETLRRETGGRK